MQGKKMVDYRNFRFSKLNTPEFQHLKYLVFWPIFGVLFLIVERLWIRDHYTSIHCSLDDLIPFCEFFFDSLFILVCFINRDASVRPAF